MGFELPPPSGNFGHSGQSVAIMAHFLMTSLAVQGDWERRTHIPWEPGQRRRWLQTDYMALDWLVELESYHWPLLPTEKAASLSEAEEQTFQLARLDELFDTLHTALPFSEAERHWLIKTYGDFDATLDDYRKIPTQIRRTEGEVISGGIRHVVKGRDLMRRWWAWRRLADEFAGQDSFRVACFALADIVAMTDKKE